MVASHLLTRVGCIRPAFKRHTIECNAASHDVSSAPSTSVSNFIGVVPRLAARMQNLAACLHLTHKHNTEMYQLALDQTHEYQKATTSTSIWSKLLRGGGYSGVPLLAAAPVAAVSPTVLQQLSGNYVFMVGFWGWFIAQFLKIFTKWYKTGVFTPKAFVDSGGMPSSHSSLCSAVTTAIAIQHGFGSTLFPIALCFSVIVMYDAMGVRRHAGLQAEVLNKVVAGLLEGHPISERKLKEVLGHTPRQVICGAITGIIIGLIYPRPPGL